VFNNNSNTRFNCNNYSNNNFYNNLNNSNNNYLINNKCINSYSSNSSISLNNFSLMTRTFKCKTNSSLQSICKDLQDQFHSMVFLKSMKYHRFNNNRNNLLLECKILERTNSYLISSKSYQNRN
jgi:hypothetical protein